MKLFPKKLLKLIAFGVLLFSLASCTLESKLTRSIINTRSNYKILVLKPDFLFKVNQKEDSIANLSDLSKEAKDSITISKSIFLRNIKDSLLLNTYFTSIVDELKAYGLKVYTDSSAHKFYKSDSIAYIFDISQVELDENLLPFEDKIYVDTAWYIQSFQLNAVSLDSWFEATEVNGSQKKSKILFSEHIANDIIKGSFQTSVIGEQINYRYKRENLTLEDIYKFASYSGKKNAEYIFDYIINELVKQKLNSLNQPASTQYYHYNRNYNYVSPVNQDRLIIIK